MDTTEIKVGDTVSKGMHDYSVISLPINDIFNAVNGKGQTVMLCAAEVTKWSTAEREPRASVSAIGPPAA